MNPNKETSCQLCHGKRQLLYKTDSFAFPETALFICSHVSKRDRDKQTHRQSQKKRGRKKEWKLFLNHSVDYQSRRSSKSSESDAES